MRRVIPSALALAAGLVLITLMGGCAAPPAPQPEAQPAAGSPGLTPRATTDVVADDPDDPAIWRHPTDPSRNLILGTNKIAAPAGALVVYGLDGRVRQTIAGIDRPNNVDVEYGVAFGGAAIDIAVLTERLKHRLRIFRIDAASGQLTDIGTVPVLQGEADARAEPMGVALYKRPNDQAVFAIVAPKSGGAANYLWQYALSDDGRGRMTGRMVRRFGTFSEQGTGPDEPGEIEAVAVDDALGYVYYADERFGIRKWHADPSHPEAGRELAAFGTAGYTGDREGLAIYAKDDGTGYLVSSDQIPGGSVLKLYRREGAPGAPHDHTAIVREILTTADETDGIEVSSAAMPGFPGGLTVMMNSTGRNFFLFAWDDVVR